MLKRPLNFDDIPLVLTVEELMPILGIGRNTAYELIRCEKIHSIRIGKQLRIPKDTVLDFLAQQNS